MSYSNQSSVAKQLAINHLKPVLEPCAKKQGLKWAEVLPMLKSLATVGELRDGLRVPKKLLKLLQQRIAERQAIRQLKKVLAPFLKEQELRWSKVAALLPRSVGELEAAAAAPKHFLQQIMRPQEAACASEKQPAKDSGWTKAKAKPTKRARASSTAADCRPNKRSANIFTALESTHCLHKPDPFEGMVALENKGECQVLCQDGLYNSGRSWTGGWQV